MNFKNSLLSGIIIAGGFWFVWVVFLLARVLYANWFFMSLRPEFNAGLFSYNQWYLVLLGLGIAVAVGVLGGMIYYGIINFIFRKDNVVSDLKKIKKAVGS